MDAYTKAIKEILTDKSPATPTTRTRQEIEHDIEEIGRKLKGPLSNVERVWLVDDRMQLRKQLAVMEP